MADKAKRAAAAVKDIGKAAIDKLVSAADTVVEGMVATVAEDAAAIEAQLSDEKRENAEGFAERAERQRDRATLRDQLDDYVRAVSGQVKDFAALGALAPEHPLELRFADGSKFLDGAMATAAGQFRKDGFGFAFQDKVEFPGEGDLAIVREAWVIDGERAVKCDIGVPLMIGAGHYVVFPAGHLAF